MASSPSFNPHAEWESGQPPLCGVWVAGDGIAWLATAEGDGPRVVTQTQFHPFAWVNETTSPPTPPSPVSSVFRVTAN